MYLASIRTDVTEPTFVRVTTPDTVVDDLVSLCVAAGMEPDVATAYAPAVADGILDPDDPATVVAWWVCEVSEREKMVAELKSFDGSADLVFDGLNVIVIDGAIKVI